MNRALMVLRGKLAIPLMAVGMLSTTACPPEPHHYCSQSGQLVICPPQPPHKRPRPYSEPEF
jgi:hypothetical protein